MSDERAVWTTQYINNLPDSAFAVILDGGSKDEEGKTTPRSLRKLPHHDDAGKLDPAHVRNGMSREPQTDMPEALHEKARRHLEAHMKAMMDGGMKSAPAGPELRSLGVELRVQQGEGDVPPKIVGHAAVFNSPSLDLGGFREQIAPGAFARSIKQRGNVIKSFFNHDPHYVLGRTDNKSLSVREDETGLAFEVTPPDTQWARDLIVSLDRGDVRDASFAFRVKKDKWATLEDGTQERTLLDVDLFELGPVTTGAYPAADSQVRAMLEARGLAMDGDGVPVATGAYAALRDLVDLDLLEHLAERRRAGLWTLDESEELRRLIETLQAWIPAESREEPPPEPDESWRVKAAHRRRSLELLRLRRTG